MDYTYNDYFNYYLKEFLNELINNFPEVKPNVLANYRNLLEGKDNKNDVYVKYFMTKINNHLISIAKKDDTLFNKENLLTLFFNYGTGTELNVILLQYFGFTDEEVNLVLETFLDNVTFDDIKLLLLEIIQILFGENWLDFDR